MVRHIPEEWIEAALAADAEWMRTRRSVVFTSPARDQVRMMLEAAAPLITAGLRAQLDEIDQAIRTFLAHYGHSTAASFKVANDLAEGLRQILDRKPLACSEEEGTQ